MTIQWTAALAVGHPQIDREHQELFRRAGALFEAMGKGDRAEVTLLFEFLREYVVEHFGIEERLMRESAFPGYAVHKAAHERFVREYEDLRRLLDAAGPTSAIALRVRTWLVDWLNGHIPVTDGALARHLAPHAT
jgi:hemerythrin